MPSYFLAQSLQNCRRETNEQYPGRDTTSDGWVGDVSHQARLSDHNPDWSAGGVVRATDTDKDGIDPMRLVLAAIAHPSTNYVIFNRYIWSRIRGFRRAAYTGPNPHTGHVHISILHTGEAETSPIPWLTTSSAGSRLPNIPDSPPEDDMPLTDADVAKIWANMPGDVINRIADTVWRSVVDGAAGPDVAGNLLSLTRLLVDRGLSDDDVNKVGRVVRDTVVDEPEFGGPDTVGRLLSAARFGIADVQAKVGEK